MKLAPSTILICMLISFIKSGNSITRNPRLVCYYFNWGVYAPGLAKYSPQNINPYLCTHLIYAFAGFTADFRITSADKYEDIDNGGFKYFAKLKISNPNLKLILALGGSNEQSTHFSPLSGDAKLRKKFSKQVVKFLRKFQFDGIDLVWQYPGYREGDSNDKKNYVLLVRDLLAEFKKESDSLNTNRLLISIAIPPDIKLVGNGFDIKQLNKYVDWFNLLSYNYHTSYEPFVNHHSPLYAVGNDTELNTNFSVQAYLDAGADRNKITVGIPNYGRTYKLQNVSNTERGAPSAGAGAKSNTTKEVGSLPFYEICYKLKYEPGWTTVDTNASRIGPYAYNGDQWLGYDDENSAKAKAQYAINNDLGGVVIWNINFDDFRGLCNNGKMYPFIEAVKEALFSNNEILRSSTTITPPTTPDPGVEFDCTELGEGLHPHPTNTSIYYNCVDSGPAQYGVIARELVCPVDMSFNVTTKICEITNLENNSDLPVTSGESPSSFSSSSTAPTITATEK